MLKQFLEKALPTKGVYCTTGIKDGYVRNHFHESIEDTFNNINRLNADGYNVFVAMSSFDGHSRKAEHSLYTRSFFIDLDVDTSGVNLKKYIDKSSALKALEEFIAHAELPPPVVVDSGTGVHAYWFFDQDVPSAEWAKYARKFKEICQEHLLIDPVVTADRARIMRAPGTRNFKHEPPVQSTILHWAEDSYDFSAFQEFLGPLPNDNQLVPSVLAGIRGGVDEDTAAVGGQSSNYESVFQIIAEKSLIGSGCNQIRYVLENSKTLSEPLWHSGLSIARHCVDGDEAIHMMSEDHPGYNREETIRKANATQDKPHSCDTFESRNPGGCTGCPQRGRITNPLYFGRKLKANLGAGLQSVGTVGGIVQDTGPLPAEIYNFSRGRTGAIIYTPPSTIKDGKVIQDEDVTVSAHNIYPVKRMFSNIDGECLLMRYYLPNDPVREFLIPIKSTADEVLKIAGMNGLSFPIPAHGRHFVKYILRWSQYMLNAKAAEQMRMQMGWSEDNDSFVIGNREFKRDGTEVSTAASPLIRSIAKLLKPVGSYDLWKTAANKLNQPSLELTAFAMLCGFGSPLMRLTSTRGITVNYVGGAGHGKTGSLYSGLSLFGSPVDLMLANGKGGATYNAANQWMLGLKNIMLGMDEVSNMDPKDLSNTIHQNSQGKGKLRMQASVNAVRELELVCAMVTFMTSNQPITDKMFAIKKDPAGEMARLLEFTYEKPKVMINNPNLGKEIYDTFRENYGHAGPEYVKVLLSMGDDQVRAVVDKWIDRFVTTFGKDTTYRFYENLIGIAFAGGEIAKQAGIIDFDLERIYRVIMGHIVGGKDRVKINQMDYEGLLGEFQNRYTHGTLILEEGRVVREPKTELVARVEVHNQKYICAKSYMRKFLLDNGNSAREFEAVMRDRKILVEEKKQRLSNGWGGGNSTSPISVYVFDYVIPPELLQP
jgi:hypothetical protein